MTPSPAAQLPPLPPALPPPPPPPLSCPPQDFQFFNMGRLTELYEKEHAAELHKHALAQKEAAARAQGASDEVIAKEVLAPQPDDPQPLSEEELQGGWGRGVGGWVGGALARCCMQGRGSGIANGCRQPTLPWEAERPSRCAGCAPKRRARGAAQGGVQQLDAARVQCVCACLREVWPQRAGRDCQGH